MNDLSATERCVKCGLCLPHCPTFRLTGNEADSPRGRISLMELLDTPDSDWSPGLFRHLDQCLMCHACEAMCPSGVPFSALMDTARERLESRRQRTAGQRLASAAGLSLLTSRSGRRLGAAGLKLLQHSRLVRAPGLPAGAKRLLQLLPEPATGARRARVEPTTPPRGRISLFTGCSGELLDARTLRDVILLIERLGYAVDIPRNQGCCGALHQHSGQPRHAEELALANLRAFADNDNPVVSFASGCCAHLSGYAAMYPDAEGFTGRVADVLSFLVGQDASRLAFKPLEETVALHLPCTQRNQLDAGAPGRLLEWIPGLRTVTVNPQGGCCGAAGSYMLAQPQMSDRLGDAMVEQVLAVDARYLVTSNIGCSLQLAAGLRRRGRPMEVLHPVSLLAAQLA